MPYANIGDVKIYYEIYGSEYKLLKNSTLKKPTIIAIHGGPGVDHNFYDTPFWADAAEFAQVILIDQRGNGRSIDKSPEHWNLKQWATDIYHFCDTLGLEKPFIHGVSMGGWVAQLYASMHQDQAGGIILSDTEAFLDMKAILNAFEIKGGKQIRDIAEKYFCTPDPAVLPQYAEKCLPLCSNTPIPQDWGDRTIFTPEVRVHFKDELLSFNLLDDIKKIEIPVLYLTNTTNPLHLYKSAKKTAEAMVNAPIEFVEFENCGLVAMDAKEKALKIIKSFVEKQFNPINE
ncbi:MAG: alpha/beta hydrolase [Gammaproteobacteria bacterium]|nr:alpha/beta hydrolase [Gammaproteobacteria bacterium]